MEPVPVRLDRYRAEHELSQLRRELRFAQCTNGTKCKRDPTHVVFDPADWHALRLEDGTLVSMCDACAKQAIDLRCALDMVYVHKDLLTPAGLALLQTMHD
jgi:hypothetical protein